MRQGLTSAEEKITETVRAIESETDEEKQHNLWSNSLDEDREILGKNTQDPFTHP